MTNKGNKYDLEERTTVFAERTVDFLKTLPKNSITNPIINQTVRSVTSIAANYCEADDAESGKDFNHKISLCKKESRESKFWFRIIARAVPSKKEECKVFWVESKELNLIFASILNKRKNRS